MVNDVSGWNLIVNSTNRALTARGLAQAPGSAAQILTADQARSRRDGRSRGALDRLRRRYIATVFGAELVPALHPLLLPVDDGLRNIEEGRPQRSGIDIAGELHCDLRRRLAPR